MTAVQVLPSLSAATYEPHLLHAEERDWVEKNCYVDVVIGMLHALELEPLACLGFCAAVDFEGDNCTFFKPSHEELRRLYGVDFQELNVWRPLLEHARHHLAEGKLLSTEADSFHLPDTRGTDYRRNHVKTTIILAELDVERRRLGYFHNAGYHELDEDDFAALFGLDADPDPTALPLYAELVRVDRRIHRPEEELAEMARGFLSRHVRRRPATNPVVRFRQRFEEDLPWLQEEGLEHYHAWAFATVRQLGAASELLALHLRWLSEAGGEATLEPAADELATLSGTAKTFILKAARAVTRRRPVDASDLFETMAGSWERGMEALVAGLELPEERGW